MTVDVHEQVYLSTFKCLFNHFFEIVNLRGNCLGWVQPLPVQIVPTEAAAVVANNDSIGVEHGYDLKHIFVPEGDCLLLIAHEKVDDALHNKGSLAFSRMDSGTDYNGRSLSNLILGTFQICYD